MFYCCICTCSRGWVKICTVFVKKPSSRRKVLCYRRIFWKRCYIWIKKSHKLPNVSQRILYGKQRILWSLMPNEHRESVFMLFVSISSIFMSLFKGHVACWNFSLIGSHCTQLFLHPLPRETKWGTPDVKWHGWLNGGKNQNLKKIPTNPKPPKKSHGGFVSLKNFQKALNHMTRKIPKKYSPNFLIQKILESKLSNSKKSFDHPCTWNLEYPPGDQHQ